MSQRDGQIYVCVKDHALWEKLYDLEIKEDLALNAKTGKDIFGDIPGNEWYIDGGWSPEFGGQCLFWYGGMGNLIREIQWRLGRENCVILGCLTDINTDPFEYIYYSLGGYPEVREVRGIRGGPHIYEIDKWIEWAKLALKPEELLHLARFDEMSRFIEALSPVKKLTNGSGDERRGRMYIAVKDPAQWANLAGLKLTSKSFALPKDFVQRISETSGYEFIWDKDWHVEYGDPNAAFPLKQIVSKIRLKLGSNDCVILADCADPNVSPVYEAACCADGHQANKAVCAPLEDVPINSVQKWLHAAGFQINAKKKAFLKEFPSAAFDFARSAK